MLYNVWSLDSEKRSWCGVIYDNWCEQLGWYRDGTLCKAGSLWIIVNVISKVHVESNKSYKLTQHRNDIYNFSFTGKLESFSFPRRFITALI